MGVLPEDIGFSKPDEIDLLRKEYFFDALKKHETRHIQQSWNINWDVRFFAKVAIALASVFVGDPFFETTYCHDLNKALWDIDNQGKNLVRGSPFLSQPDEKLKKFISEEDAVVLVLQQIRGDLIFSLSISNSLTSTVVFAENIKDNEIIGDGLVYVFYPPLQECIELTFPEFLAHKSGGLENLEMKKAQSSKGRFDQINLLPIKQI